MTAEQLIAQYTTMIHQTDAAIEKLVSQRKILLEMIKRFKMEPEQRETLRRKYISACDEISTLWQHRSQLSNEIRRIQKR